MDRPYVVDNEAARQRLQDFVAQLTDDDLTHPVGEHWTVSVALAHLAFLDRLWHAKFDEWERIGVVELPPMGELINVMNDGMLRWWRSMAPVYVKHDVIAAAEAVDRRAAELPEWLVEAILAVRPRTLIRALHRHATLDELDQALTR